MIVRIVAAIALSCAIIFAVQAQQRRREPLEKYSGSPVPSQLSPSRPVSIPPGQTQFLPTAWVKFCGHDASEPKPKNLCLTLKEARLETGQVIAGAALIEEIGEENKVLRLKLPPGMLLTPGVRVFIDGDEPRTGPYTKCEPSGCLADFPVRTDFIARLKKGHHLHLQGSDISGQLATYLLPLGDFAKAFEGPATDPRQLESPRDELRLRLK